MNFLKTIAIGMFALLATAANASTFEQIKNASFELYLNNADGDHAICSGQFISPTEFLTAAHCTVDKTGTYFVVTEKYGEKTSFDLKLKSTNTPLDTATFTLVDDHAAFPFVDVAKPSEVKLTAGDTIVTTGFPDAMGILLLQLGNYSSTVSGIIGWPGSGEHYLTNVNTAPGNSGSGLYTKIDGTWKLIGTLSGGPFDALWVSYYSTVDGVAAVL